MQKNEKGSAAGQILDTLIPMEEGDPLEATPDDQLIIMQVQSDTLADGRLRVGDKILTVNNRVPKNVQDFYRLLNQAAAKEQCVVIRVRRDRNKASELDVHNQIPPNRAQYIQRREGYLYKLVSIAHQKGAKLGLSIKKRQNRVLVSGVEVGSLSAKVFERGDQIVDVDCKRMTDTEVTQAAIKQGFKERQYFTAVIARPVSAEARLQVEEDLKRSTTTTTTTTTTEKPHQQSHLEEPSHKMADDVYEIAMKEIERLQDGQTCKGKSIVVKPGSKMKTHVAINERIHEKKIVSDVPDKSKLQKVPPSEKKPKEK